MWLEREQSLVDGGELDGVDSCGAGMGGWDGGGGTVNGQEIFGRCDVMFI